MDYEKGKDGMWGVKALPLLLFSGDTQVRLRLGPRLRVQTSRGCSKLRKILEKFLIDEKGKAESNEV